MTLRERLEHNFALAVLGALATAGGIVFGVTDYFNAQHVDRLEQSHSQEIGRLEQAWEAERSGLTARLEQLERRLASIDRGIGGEGALLDVRKLLIDRGSSAAIPEHLRFFPDAGFYASLDDSFWSYQQTDELALMRQLTGAMAPLPQTMEEAFASVPIHLWRGDQLVVMRDGRDTLQLFPFIFVQRLDYERAFETFGAFGSGGLFEALVEQSETRGEPTERAQPSPQDDGSFDDFVLELSDSFAEDAASTFLMAMNTVNFMSTMSDPNHTYTLQEVQKVGPVLYARATRTFSGVQVEGRPATVYMSEEYIVLAGRSHMLMVRITLPSQEPRPRSGVQARIQTWLDNVKFALN